MQHDDVYHVDEHDFCLITNFCKRCGLGEVMVSEQMLKCRFSLNLIAISHMRAYQIQQEKIEENRERFRRMVEKIKEEVSGLVEKED